MAGVYENGFDYIPSSWNGFQLTAELMIEDWFAPEGFSLGGIFDPRNTLHMVTPGRYGYGNRISFDYLVESGGGGPAAQYVLVRLVPASAEGFLSAGMRIEDNNFQSPMLCFFDLTNNIYMTTITFEPNGVVAAWSGGAYGTLLGKSDPGAYEFGVDFDVEIHNKVGSSTGDVEIRIHTIGSGNPGAGGTPALHVPNCNTKPGTSSTYNGIGFGWRWRGGGFTNGFLEFKIDDLRYYDTTTALCNTWLGTCRVQTLLAAGDGATVDFTRSNTGLAHWQNIINTNVDDTLYLFDPTTGDFNLSTPQPLVNSSLVFWLGMLTFARQDDATQRFMKNRIVSSGVTADGASFATPQTYAGDHDVFPVDPNTGIQFTAAAVNALSFGPLVFA